MRDSFLFPAAVASPPVHADSAHQPCVFLSPPESKNISEDSAAACQTAESEEDELQAVAKHFGKDLEELTLEALLKLDQKTEEEGEEALEEDGVPRRKAPSLASILGPMPSAATLGLSSSIGDCLGEEKENVQRKRSRNYHSAMNHEPDRWTGPLHGAAGRGRWTGPRDGAADGPLDGPPSGDGTFLGLSSTFSAALIARTLVCGAAHDWGNCSDHQRPVQMFPSGPLLSSLLVSVFSYAADGPWTRPLWWAGSEGRQEDEDSRSQLVLGGFTPAKAARGGGVGNIALPAYVRDCVRSCRRGDLSQQSAVIVDDGSLLARGGTGDRNRLLLTGDDRRRLAASARGARAAGPLPRRHAPSLASHAPLPRLLAPSRRTPSPSLFHSPLVPSPSAALM
ncbi:hypothetical protein D4764_16G0009450 [Takifugu flavidus]|uniref:Uncharacterized protein n=1 Tax=Takifugu flavidus TaxID=433684 RepID=A0A5C6P035_9TELE|nr:hypothetical protein D4764_16G0009450 [Takifugu flavidus]